MEIERTKGDIKQTYVFYVRVEPGTKIIVVSFTGLVVSQRDSDDPSGWVERQRIYIDSQSPTGFIGADVLPSGEMINHQPIEVSVPKSVWREATTGFTIIAANRDWQR
jgi:hypothetical protein